MKDSLFFHPLMKPIKYHHKLFLQITGLDLKTQFLIQQVIEWSILGHRYSEKQIEDLNQEEIKWICREKQIGKSHYEYITLTNRENLLFHLSPKKGSILSYYLNLIQNQIEISDYVMQVNSLLDKISLAYNQVNQNQNINVHYRMKPIQIRDINTTYLESFMNLNEVQSLEFMSNKELLDELLKILEIILQQSEKRYLLKVENLITILNDSQIQSVLSKLYDLSLRYQIEVINFAKNEYELLVNEALVDSILICGDSIEQLDDYISVDDYIRRNYPIEYNGNIKDLLMRIQRVSPYLFSKKGSYFVKEHIDQVFFVLLNQGMGYADYEVLQAEKINILEWNFLEDNLY